MFQVIELFKCQANILDTRPEGEPIEKIKKIKIKIVESMSVEPPPATSKMQYYTICIKLLSKLISYQLKQHCSTESRAINMAVFPFATSQTA